MSDNTVIRIQGLWKRYGLPIGYKVRSYMQRILKHGKVPTIDANHGGPWALRNLDLTVQRGEVVGVIGQNGAGKSTLLKVLSGITPPTRGVVEITGRVFPMIELNAGIHPELTGRENIFLLGAIMGIRRQDIKKKIPTIEQFCELGEWLDRPVRMYSSGMLARLGFAVAVNVDADVLLIDEVMAVGDISFQRKCFERIEQIHSSGNTVLLVSHNLRQIERLCDTVLLLDAGCQKAYGTPPDVLSQYYEAANLKILEQRFPDGQAVRIPQISMEHAEVDILGARLFNGHGQETINFQTGDQMIVEVHYHARYQLEHVILGFGIMTIDSFYLSGFTNEHVTFNMPLKEQGLFRVGIRSLPLLNGIYILTLKVKHPTNGSDLGGCTGLATFSVSTPESLRLSKDYGVVTMDVQWENPLFHS
jgi:lipopolysaccharide transport system ATP-binding protein